MSEPVRAEVVEEGEMPTELANRPNVSAVMQPENWTPKMVIPIAEAVRALDERDDFMRKVLSRVEGAVYTIPGGDKPALGKSGAERLLNVYGLFSETEDEDAPILDFAGKIDGEPLIVYRRRCTIYRQTGLKEDERFVVARMSGTCTSREVKYRYRNEDRKCPSCGAAAILHSKDGGWFCWRKKGGCGDNFEEKDALIVGQTVGRVPNPDVADLTNTILKIADKRAVVAATILATSWSDKVTQDLEEGHPNDPPAAADAPARATATTPTPQAHSYPARHEQDGRRPEGPNCPSVGCTGHLLERETKTGNNIGSKYLVCSSGKENGCGMTPLWNTSLDTYKVRPADGGDVGPEDYPPEDARGPEDYPMEGVEDAGAPPVRAEGRSTGPRARTNNEVADEVVALLRTATEAEMTAIAAVFTEHLALACLTKRPDGTNAFSAKTFNALAPDVQQAILAEVRDVAIPF